MSKISQLTKVAQAGNADAQYQLGYRAEFGDGVEQELATAISWYKKAAEQHHTQAQQKLAEYKQKFEELCQADTNNVQIQFQLGYYYGNGIGTEIDNDKAFYWYTLSANQGNPAAYNKLGDYYYHGWSVEKDEIKAAEWFAKSAEKGYPTGQCNLGWCYSQGCGVEQNYEKAFYWLTLSAKQGDHAAQRLLGWCYSNGIGVDVDYAKANYWMDMAADTPNVNLLIVIG